MKKIVILQPDPSMRGYLASILRHELNLTEGKDFVMAKDQGGVIATLSDYGEAECGYLVITGINLTGGSLFSADPVKMADFLSIMRDTRKDVKIAFYSLLEVPSGCKFDQTIKKVVGDPIFLIDAIAQFLES